MTKGLPEETKQAQALQKPKEDAKHRQVREQVSQSEAGGDTKLSGDCI